MSINKRQVVTFRKLIQPNEEDWLQFRIPNEGTIEELRIRFYAGTEHSLVITPFIERKAGKVPDYLIEGYNGNHDITGDDDTFIFPLTYEVERNDFIKVHYKNTDTNYAYHLSCDVLVDYLGGKNSAR